ncbi:MAG: hypothetical protein LBS53_06890 [Synergistaceae bacterium]|jgi:hypothetical protein|nr:hypothetical protein [Synergistaceae bacterium]
MQKKIFDTLSAVFERARILMSGKALTGYSCLLLVLIAAVFIRSLSVNVPVDLRSSLLEFLPEPDAGASVIIVSALRGEFPQDVARLYGVSEMTLFMPIFDSADAMALLIAEGDGRFSICGVFVPGLEEYDVLNAGDLPEDWKRDFPGANLRSAGRKRVYRLSAENLPEPLYLAAMDDLVFAADSMRGIDRLMAVNDGSHAGIKRKWTVEPQWGGHVYLSDGGLILAAANAAADSRARAGILEIEAAWITSADAGESRAKWKVSGAENIVNRAFLNDLRPRDWEDIDIFVPDPLVLAFGINLPNPGRRMASLPGPLKYAAEQMRKIGIRTSEIQAILTGRTAFSIGGRTQLLWFDLPGIVSDLPGRGGASFNLIDKFWSELFIGAEPKPVEGFSHGGLTNLPFTVLAAANDEKTLIGLVTPDAEQNFEAKDLIASASQVIAWAYVDFPMLGASLAEIPAINSVIYEDGEEERLDEESANNLKNAMSSLGRIFITMESAASGSAICYH